MTCLPALLLSGRIALAQAPGSPPAMVVTTRNVRTVEGTGGAYLGYSDRLESDGRFETIPGADGVELKARYAWTWKSSEGDEQGDTERRTVTVDPATRRYKDRCDLDDMDGLPATDLATWLWVPTGLAVGDLVQILDEQARVEALETIEEAGATWSAVRLQATGTGTRDDDYGQMATTWTESWWYDTNTGYFLRSAYTERATGTVEGLAGDFVLEERVHRTRPDQSSAPAAEPTTGESIASGLCCASPLGLVAGLAGLFVLRRKRIRLPRERVRVPTLGTVTLADAQGSHELRGLRLPGDHPLAAVAPDLACRALAAGGRVQLARQGTVVVGLAMVEPPGKVGTVLAGPPRLVQALVYNLGLRSWFTTAESKVTAPDRFRNVETWSVLALDQPGPRAWDPSLVRRMRDADRPAVIALLEAEGGDPAEAWLQAQLDDGDVCFVAMIDGRVVGCGLCGMHGDLGRLHGLVVHPDHRGQGIGAELLRARIDALALLGATRLLTEIATWNLASMHLAQEAGFRPAGSLVVESLDASSKPGQPVRR